MSDRGTFFNARTARIHSHDRLVYWSLEGNYCFSLRKGDEKTSPGLRSAELFRCCMCSNLGSCRRFAKVVVGQRGITVVRF